MTLSKFVLKKYSKLTKKYTLIASDKLKYKKNDADKGKPIEK